MQTIDQIKERKKLQMREKRAAARAAGIKLPSETWASRNPEKHRRNVAKWRSENESRNGEIARSAQQRRRSTPWGAINNNVWVVMMNGVLSNSTRRGKYSDAVGYTWAALRAHLQAQFEPGMDWENWGSVWELDHIEPISKFKYESLEDPLFRQGWALSNLRPLSKEANAAKGCKPLEFP